MSRPRQNYIEILKKISTLFIGDNVIFCVGELHDTGLWLVSFVQIFTQNKNSSKEFSKSYLFFRYSCQDFRGRSLFLIEKKKKDSRHLTHFFLTFFSKEIDFTSRKSRQLNFR